MSWPSLDMLAQLGESNLRIVRTSDMRHPSIELTVRILSIKDHTVLTEVQDESDLTCFHNLPIQDGKLSFQKNGDILTLEGREFTLHEPSERKAATWQDLNLIRAKVPSRYEALFKDLDTYDLHSVSQRLRQIDCLKNNFPEEYILYSRTEDGIETFPHAYISDKNTKYLLLPRRKWIRKFQTWKNAMKKIYENSSES